MAESSLSLAQIWQRLRPWAFRNLDKTIFNSITDEEFIDMLNLVTQDLNIQAELRLERYNKNAVENTTNYEMQGEIQHVYYFKYKDAAWQDQRYSWVNDVLLLKNVPASNNIEMDVYYLRRTMDITNQAVDQIDLPGYAILDFLELVKTRMRIEFGKDHSLDYNAELQYRATQCRIKRGNNPLDALGTFERYVAPEYDQRRYDITDQFVSRDSVAAYDDGTYEIVD